MREKWARQADAVASVEKREGKTSDTSTTTSLRQTKGAEHDLGRE